MLFVGGMCNLIASLPDHCLFTLLTRDVRKELLISIWRLQNFKLAQKCSFHALEVLLVVRNAKFQPMYPLLEGVTVR